MKGLRSSLNLGIVTATRKGIRSLFLGSGASAPWPSGVNGPLNIANNGFFHLTNGTAPDWSSITMGTNSLLIIDQGVAWTCIGCAGDVVMGAGARILGPYGVFPSSQTVTRTAPDGRALSWVFVQAQGGAGGNSYDNLHVGGLQNSGNGGGGGGGTDGFNADASIGGTGGDSIPPSGGGGVGAPSYSPNPGDSGAEIVSSESTIYGNGGGGGAKGYHGTPIYIRVLGDFSGSSAFVDVSGRIGGEGGSGGDVQGDDSNIASGGGGGGAGAGGAAAKIVVRYHTSAGGLPQFLCDGGSNTSGGPGGDAVGAAFTFFGNDGAMSQNGADGIADIAVL